MDEEQALSESPPDLDIENPIDDDAGTEETTPESDDGVTVDAGEEEPDDPQRGPIPYDRFKSVNEAKKARDKALEARGLRFDEATGTVVETAPSSDEIDWDAPDESARPVDEGEVYTPQFWQLDAEDMASNESWRQIAAQLGFDPDEAVRNEWAAIKNIARGQLEQSIAQRQTAEEAEASARTELNSELKVIRSDPEFSASAKAVAFVEAEVKRLKAAGNSALRIKAIMPQIKERAYYTHRADFIQAEARKLAKDESGRKIRFGAQSPEGTPADSERTYKVTSEIRRYAKSFGTDANRLAAEVARIKGEDQ